MQQCTRLCSYAPLHNLWEKSRGRSFYFLSFHVSSENWGLGVFFSLSLVLRDFTNVYDHHITIEKKRQLQDNKNEKHEITEDEKRQWIWNEDNEIRQLLRKRCDRGTQKYFIIFLRCLFVF